MNNIFKKFLIEQQIVDLESTLKQKGYTDLKKISPTRIAILTDENREDVLDSLMTDLAEFNPVKSQSTTHSSIGHIEIAPNLRVWVKPKSRQGAGSAGIDNEEKLINFINDYIKTAGTFIDVIFKAGNKKFVCREVTGAAGVGKDTAGRKKADIVINGLKEYKISLKKDSAIAWESADNLWKSEAIKYVKKLTKSKKIKLIKTKDFFKVEPNFAVKASDKDSKDVIFGTDIKKGSGCVITKTFKDSDFTFNDVKNELEVDCSDIIESLKDVDKDKEVYFFVRNDSTRRTKDFIPGLRILAVYFKRVKIKTVLKVKSS